MGTDLQGKTPYNRPNIRPNWRFTFRLFIRHFSIVGLDLRRFRSFKTGIGHSWTSKWSKRASAPNATLKTIYVSLLFKNFISINSRNLRFYKYAKLQTRFLERQICKFRWKKIEIFTNRMTNDYFIKANAVLVFFVYFL